MRVYRWRKYTATDEGNSTYHYTSREQGTTNFKPLIGTTNTSTAPVVGEYYWTQLGYDIEGDGLFGYGLKLSFDGSTGVIGAVNDDGASLSNNGSTKVYNFKEQNTLSISNKTSSFAVTEDGYVGIGTTIPGNKLEVWGSTKLSGSVTTGHLTSNEGLTVTGNVNVTGSIDVSNKNVNSDITCNTSLSIGNNSLIDTTTTGWLQIGSTIYGGDSNDNSGRIVSANQDCTIIGHRNSFK